MQQTAVVSVSDSDKLGFMQPFLGKMLCDIDAVQDLTCCQSMCCSSAGAVAPSAVCTRSMLAPYGCRCCSCCYYDLVLTAMHQLVLFG
jgi:hypothetical protein